MYAVYETILQEGSNLQARRAYRVYRAVRIRSGIGWVIQEYIQTWIFQSSFEFSGLGFRVLGVRRG